MEMNWPVLTWYIKKSDATTGIIRTCIFKRHFTANNTLEGRHLHCEKVYPSRVKPRPKNMYEIIINNKLLYQIQNWILNSIHYFSENTSSNRITVNTILVYIFKWTRLAPKITTSNCHVICKRESFNWPEYGPLSVDTSILYSLFMT